MVEKLQNRTVAWVVTVCVVLLSVFLGAWGSYGGLRGDVAYAFDEEIAPLVAQSIVPAFNVQTLAANYVDAEAIAYFGIGGIVDDIQGASNPMHIYRHFQRLYDAVKGIYDHVATHETDEEQQILINNYLHNFLEMELIMHQAGYNNLARDFNARLSRNLGPLVRGVVGEMPVFD